MIMLMRTVPRLLPLVAVVAIAPALATEARAQESHFDRLSFSASAGINRSGPSAEMRRALQSAGWNDDVQLVGGVQTYPHSDESDLGWSLRADYRWTERLGVGLLVGHNGLGSAGGHRSDGGSFGRYLSFTPEVFTVALLGSFHPVGADEGLGVRLQAGPAMHTPTIDRGEGGEARLGALVGAGLSARVWGLTWLVDVQRRFVGDVEYGPHPDFARSAASFDHYTIQFGLGIGW